MDPISAAGIGLSVASLAFQVFSGCITAYQMFAEAEDMPAAYRFLRVRLRIEQSRLLRWGEKVGLAEEFLDNPSRVLQLNHNLIFDILLEVQALFKKTVKIQAKFGSLVPDKDLPDRTQSEMQTSETRFLKKTLNAFNKLPQAPKRLQWSLIKHEQFQGLVEKLIGYNDAIEGLLEFGAVEKLLDIQRQTYMTILQLNSKVDDLKQMSLAMQIQKKEPTHIISTSITINEFDTMRRKENQELADLASFKAQEILFDTEVTVVEPLFASDILFPVDDHSTRCEATFGSQHVWIEWKEYNSDHQNPKWGTIITQRVKNLVTLLASSKKSPYFNVPHCLGYFNIVGDTPNSTRYGFVYQKPHGIAPETPYTTLYSQLLLQTKPSLTQRIALAHTIARSLMYLHSVNWLHKGLRSNNILFFFSPTTSGRQLYSSPIVSGFEYSRADLVDEYTELVPEHSENDVYRHPQTLASVHLRSKKSNDIYSLGVILVEIAHWKRIQDIVHLPRDEKLVKKAIRNLRETLLRKDSLMELEGLVGDSYSQAVVACLEGLVGLEVNEENPAIGVQIQKAFHDRVVAKLSSMRI